MSDNCKIEPDERLVDYSDGGVDLTLIRWMLSLTPEERLRFLDKRIAEIHLIRELNGIQSDCTP